MILSLPGVAHHLLGGVFLKEERIPAGAVVVLHKHLYDHLSYLVSGTVELEHNGVRRELTGPVSIDVLAGEYHGVKALTDVVWLCIHATEAAEAEEAQLHLIAPDSSGPEMRAMAEAML